MTVADRAQPAPWRQVLGTHGVRPLLIAFAVSYLGDAMSAVTVAWLAIEIAPRSQQSLWVGAAVAAYSLPGVIGTFVFAPIMRRQPSRLLVVGDSVLRASLLGAIAVLRAFHRLDPVVYVGLLGVSSLLFAWGLAGRYTVLSERVGPEGTLFANSLQSSMASAALVAGPGLAGVLVAVWGAGPLIGLDAASYALLAVIALRSAASVAPPPPPVEAGAAVGGLKLMRQHGLLGLLMLTWFFYLLYGPVEVALPLHVSHDLHHGASLLGLYWAVFGIGAAIGSLLTGLLRTLPIWPTALVIVAGWGVSLVPFGVTWPVAVTVVSLGVGGLIYGPYVPLTYGLIQSRVPGYQQAVVLAARGAMVSMAAPIGAAFGGPLSAALGASRTLAASGLATVLAVAVIGAAGPIRRRWRHAPPQPPSSG